MMAPLYYDKRGNPIQDVIKWSKLFEDKSYCIIRQEFTPKGSYKISTVWLGIDHDSHWDLTTGPNPNPLIFETMVFDHRPDNEEKSDLFPEMERYSTEEEALKGHKKLLTFYILREKANYVLKEEDNA